MEHSAGSRLRRAGRRTAAGAAGLLGYELVRKHYYSPIPDLESIPPEVWERRSELSGVAFEPAVGLRFVQTELASHMAQYDPPLESTGDPRDFFLNNGLYGAIDAHTLYAMVRRFEPARVLELGSGMSTLVIADAREPLRAGEGGWHIACDPFPRDDLRPTLEEIASLRPLAATEVDIALFGELRAGDFLFVDTTHTVKVGSDVNRIVLDVLPRLKPGVIVHFHDIFLPWEYPRQYMAERRFFWAEQYLLQAFLAFNDEFEVLFGARALQRDFPAEIGQLVAQPESDAPAAALWLRRRAAA